MDNTFLTIREACDFARKWLPPIDTEDKIAVMATLTGTDSTIGTPLLRKYIQMLRPYTEILGISGKGNKPREADCVASGIVFFYGCLFYIMHFPGWGSHIEDIFLYNLLYILVDHYIDDIAIDDNRKRLAISQMFVLINDPTAQLSFIDPVLKTIAVVYHRLITRCPNTKDHIITLFQLEVEGLKIQNIGSCRREQYYDIAVKKGGYTMQVLQKIVGNDDPELDAAAFHIGSIMQLIDDILDIYADKEKSIYTIATYDLSHTQNLDELWVDIMNRISKIHPKFTIFIILYTIFAVYIPDRLPQNYSQELRHQTNSLNLFNFDGSTMLVEAIMSEFTAIELLELLAT